MQVSIAKTSDALQKCSKHNKHISRIFQNCMYETSTHKSGRPQNTKWSLYDEQMLSDSIQSNLIQRYLCFWNRLSCSRDAGFWKKGFFLFSVFFYSKSSAAIFERIEMLTWYSGSLIISWKRVSSKILTHIGDSGRDSSASLKWICCIIFSNN